MSARLLPSPAEPSGASLLDRCTFPPSGSALTCGVSGGADSLALLALATEAGCRVTAVHVDHGLRPGSAAEADVVAEAAERFGARFDSVRLELVDGPNLEERARTARHRALGANAATGHTADDQAETVLANLLRGAGVDGLAGMRAGARHPILALRRSETVALCAQLGLVTVIDFFEEAQTLYLVMDFVEGQNLAQIVHDPPGADVPHPAIPEQPHVPPVLPEHPTVQTVPPPVAQACAQHAFRALSSVYRFSSASRRYGR